MMHDQNKLTRTLDSEQKNELKLTNGTTRSERHTDTSSRTAEGSEIDFGESVVDSSRSSWVVIAAIDSPACLGECAISTSPFKLPV